MSATRERRWVTPEIRTGRPSLRLRRSSVYPTAWSPSVPAGPVAAMCRAAQTAEARGIVTANVNESPARAR